MKKITQLLTRSNAQISHDRAERITNSVERAAKREIFRAEEKVDQLVDEKEKMLDMSSDNQTTTKNAIENLKSDDFVSKFAELDVEITLAKQKLKIVKQSVDSLIGEAEEDTTSDKK